MGIEIGFYEKVESDELLQDIWKILCECDLEFVPPLSHRDSSYQSVLDKIQHQEGEPHSYFKTILEQHFILALDRGRVIGFMTFRHSYTCPELRDYSPSNYITTICIKSIYRNRGIAKKLYNYLERQLPETYRLPFLTTRTWTTNLIHHKILEEIGFKQVIRLENHRGPGIDTVYYAKSM